MSGLSAFRKFQSYFRMVSLQKLNSWIFKKIIALRFALCCQILSACSRYFLQFISISNASGPALASKYKCSPILFVLYNMAIYWNMLKEPTYIHCGTLVSLDLFQFYGFVRKILFPFPSWILLLVLGLGLFKCKCVKNAFENAGESSNTKGTCHGPSFCRIYYFECGKTRRLSWFCVQF